MKFLAAYEFLIMKNTTKHIDVSRLFIYFNSRIKDGAQESNIKDKGTHIRSAIAGLKEFGCCKEKLHPYEPSNTNRKPEPNCYLEAKKYCITEGMQLKTDLDEMKACLAQGYPFAFGLELFETFSQAETNGGKVNMPDFNNESQRKHHGWHALLAVGYSDKSRCFIVRNSWGEKWVSLLIESLLLHSKRSPSIYYHMFCILSNISKNLLSFDIRLFIEQTQKVSMYIEVSSLNQF